MYRTKLKPAESRMYVKQPEPVLEFQLEKNSETLWKGTKPKEE